MSDKNPNPIRDTNLKTNRREFLKTGAAFAGAALLGQTFNAAFVENEMKRQEK